MDEWQQLQSAYRFWGDETFGNGKKREPLPSLKHLEKEVQELIAAPNDLKEYADCMLLLIAAASLSGFSMYDLLRACKYKFGVNKDRKWSKPDADGVCYHVEEEE